MASYTFNVFVMPSSPLGPAIAIVPISQQAAFGTDSLYWTQMGQNAQSWTFAGFTFTSATLNNPVVDDATISLTDWNDATSVQTLTYSLGISYAGTTYWSDPYVLNEPPGQ